MPRDAVAQQRKFTTRLVRSRKFSDNTRRRSRLDDGPTSQALVRHLADVNAMPVGDSCSLRDVRFRSPPYGGGRVSQMSWPSWK